MKFSLDLWVNVFLLCFLGSDAKDLHGTLIPLSAKLDLDQAKRAKFSCFDPGFLYYHEDRQIMLGEFQEWLG